MFCNDSVSDVFWHVLCRPCATEKHADHADFHLGVDVPVKTTFKCPAEKCETKTLSFQDFIYGFCCLEQGH